jgi:hypothetical protein
VRTTISPIVKLLAAVVNGRGEGFAVFGFPLVPKLSLGTQIDAKLRFAN